MPDTAPADPGEPDFTALFPVCICSQADCEDCEAWQLTPRTAAALWVAAQLTADEAYDDVVAHGDTPVSETDDWALFDQYPPITGRQGADWRRQAARAFDDLAGDLASGRWPRPRCPAEEMALHLILERARDWWIDGEVGVRPEELAALPAHADDLDWQGALDALFADHDLLLLFDAELDGIEDPAALENRLPRMGDYRPAAWFTPFDAITGRDPQRGFRR
jgi:hypothetical protein